MARPIFDGKARRGRLHAPTVSRRPRGARLVCAALALLFLMLPDSRAAGQAGSAVQQSSPSGPGPASGSFKKGADEDHYYVALGPVLGPDYEGSDDYQIDPLIIARWIRRGAYVELKGTTLSANVIPMSLFQVGPVVRWHRERDDVSDDRVDRMRDVSGALEAGGFVGMMLRDPDSPRRRIGLNLQVLQDVSGSHDGYEAKLALEGGAPLNDRLVLDLELFSSYASDGYMDTYFSVDPDNAARSGLAQFDAGAGVKDVGFDLMLSYRITDHFGVGLIGGYRRYLGDAGESPVVADAGSRNQFTGALVATFTY